MQKHILVLGGSNEGFALAKTLQGHKNYTITSSLAGRTSLPKKPVGPYRIGGFGGSEGLKHYINTNKIDAIIDATHPFAQNITKNAAKAAGDTKCPLLHIWRPQWKRAAKDNWIEVPTMQAAAERLTKHHAPIFLTIGRLELAAFLPRTDLAFITRAIEPNQNEQWPKNFHFIYAKGPFDYNQELALIKKYNIKAIVTKNSGGPGAFAKIEVARTLNLPVIMINRPPKPKGNLASTPEEALNWLTNTF